MKCLLTIGFFDGVHRGHAALLSEAAKKAAEAGLSPAVLTFEGLGGVKRAEELNLPADRDLLIRRILPCAEIISLSLDRELRSVTAEKFFSDWILGRFGAGYLVVGENFTFGSDRKDAGTLLSLAEENGVRCDVLPLLADGEGTVSSSRIRALLHAGSIPEANALLGHAHLFRGVVEPGRQVGRTLGFPTANLSYPPSLVSLPLGVYAAYAVLPDQSVFPAVLNLGRRPTFDAGDGIFLEAHLPGFRGDLYGKLLEIRFVKMLRPEKRFSSPEELRAAVEKDKLAAAEILGRREDAERRNT
ncbi:MAG: riboflavin biosynthesis protein RibF [Clostridia bacterium]|nr:riboflavin biosynthesis protein RibF [Clostridia bacterium]